MKQRTRSRNEDSAMLTASQTMQKYQMSRWVLEGISKACGAKIKYGRWVRYDTRKIEAYLPTLAKTS